MGDDARDITEQLRSTVIGAAAIAGSVTSIGEAVVAGANLPEPVKDAAITLMATGDEALTEAAVGIRAGEDSANASPVPESEAAEHSDPPDSIAVGGLAAVEEFESDWSDQVEGDWSDPGDATESAGDSGEQAR